MTEHAIPLENWGIWLGRGNKVHLVGNLVRSIRGHRSPEVETFNLFSMVATTASGRSYRLVGDGSYVKSLLIIHAKHGSMLNNWFWITPVQLALRVDPPQGATN